MDFWGFKDIIEFGAESVATVLLGYSVSLIHSATALISSMSLKRTPLFTAHQQLGGKLIEFGGWEMPVQYTSIVEEHHAVRRSAGILGIEIAADAAALIAARSRGTPRIAGNLLRRVRDYAQVRADGRITEEIANKALEILEIDKDGLDEMDTRILESVIGRASCRERVCLYV